MNSNKLTNSNLETLKLGFAYEVEDSTHYFFIGAPFIYRGANSKALKTPEIKRLNKAKRSKPALFFTKHDHSALFTLEELAKRISTHDVLRKKVVIPPRYIVMREIERSREASYDPYDPNPALLELETEMSYDAVLASTRNQEVHALNGNIDRTNVYQASRNYRCLLNEISMLNDISFIFSVPRRVPGTPDHEPKFMTTLVTRNFNIEPLIGTSFSKVSAQEKVSELWFKTYLNVPETLALPFWTSIFLSENGYSLAQKRARNVEMHSGNGNIFTYKVPKIDVTILKKTDSEFLFEHNLQRYQFAMDDIKILSEDIEITFASRRSHDDFVGKLTRQTISNL